MFVISLIKSYQDDNQLQNKQHVQRINWRKWNEVAKLLLTFHLFILSSLLLESSFGWNENMYPLVLTKRKCRGRCLLANHNSVSISDSLLTIQVLRGGSGAPTTSSSSAIATSATATAISKISSSISSWNNLILSSTSGIPSPSSSSISYKVSKCALQGARPYMEDECFIAHDGKLCAVFDGHGGSAVSRYVRSNFYANFQSALSEHMQKFTNPSVKQPEEGRILTENEVTDANTTTIHLIDADPSLDIHETEKQQQLTESSHPRNTPINNNKVPSIDSCIHALRTAFRNINHEVQRVSHWSFKGTTAVAILIHEDHNRNGQRSIISVNIGDSRAVLSRNSIAIDLTTDHKPNDPNEKQRIEHLGGEVQWCGLVDAHGNPVLDTGVYRINGNLAVSRAIGDRSEYPFITAEPDMKLFPILSEYDEFIVIASDGLYDVMSSQDVVSFLHKCLADLGGRSTDQDVLAKVLAEEAILRGSLDNVTVIIIWLKKVDRQTS